MLIWDGAGRWAVGALAAAWNWAQLDRCEMLLARQALSPGSGAAAAALSGPSSALCRCWVVVGTCTLPFTSQASSTAGSQHRRFTAAAPFAQKSQSGVCTKKA